MQNSYTLDHDRFQELIKKVQRNPTYIQLYEVIYGNIHDDMAARRAAVAAFMLLEHSLSWNTTCVNCARLLDSCYEADNENERLRDEVETLRSFKDME